MKRIPIIILVLTFVSIGVFLWVMRATTVQEPGTDAGDTPKNVSDWTSVQGPIQSYTILIPPGMAAEDNGEFSRLFVKKPDEPGAGPTNMIYISVVPKGMETQQGTIYNYDRNDLETLVKLSDGETAVLGVTDDPNLSQYFSYTRDSDLMVGGYGAKAYVNRKPWEFPSGTTEHRYIVETVPATYIIGGYLGADEAGGYRILREEFEEILGTLKLTPDSIVSQNPPGQPAAWETFEDPEAGVSLKYPANWQRRTEGQNFRDGDLFAVQITGQTQRPQTEFYDGASFTVMNPQVADEDAATWVRSRYDAESAVDPERPPEYTQVTIGSIPYERVYVCGLGCFPYYHTKQNGKIYGFLTYAAGPDEASYLETMNDIMENVKFTP